MKQVHARVLLGGAYVVALVEALRPALDGSRALSHPLWQFVGVCFLTLNLVALIALRPRSLLRGLAVLNVLTALAAVVGLTADLMLRNIPPHELDFVIALYFFAGLVPAVMSAFLFSESRTAITPN